MNVAFLSYARETRKEVEALAEDVESLGTKVWFDRALTGGQSWWDRILAEIRACDIFVFAVSPASLDSPACRREYEYAASLGKTILPILVADGVVIDLLPSALARVQFVDYRRQDKEAMRSLARAVQALPKSAALPDPLPEPPQVPVSYLGELKEQIEVTAQLTFDQQTGLLMRLKQGLVSGPEASSARVLLERLRARDDLYARVADEIDELFNVSKPSAADGHQPKHAVPPSADAARYAEPPKEPERQSQAKREPAATQKSAGSAPRRIEPGRLPLLLMVVVGGMMFGSFVPNIVLSTFNHSLRTSIVAILSSILLGLAPVVKTQLRILRKIGREELVNRWLWIVSAAWILGAMGGTTEDPWLAAPFGALGGGIASLVVLVHGQISRTQRAWPGS